MPCMQPTVPDRLRDPEDIDLERLYAELREIQMMASRMAEEIGNPHCGILRDLQALNPDYQPNTIPPIPRPPPRRRRLFGFL
ncbi:hypothetical protein TWF694_011183 [Orbilia ellipsospora]|uniref:Uncharacterized protein n=1 Tax=Orbilia ellipsospora TaxID=2528407 RepID=A0AAV9X8S6_9PEZI